MSILTNWAYVSCFFSQCTLIGTVCIHSFNGQNVIAFHIALFNASSLSVVTIAFVYFEMGFENRIEECVE